MSEKEDRMYESEERLQLTLDASSEGIWDWDLLTGSVYRSPRYYEIVGRQPDDFPNNFDSFKSTVHPDDLPQALARIEAHKQGKTSSIEFDYRLVTGSDDLKWLRVKGRIVKRGSDNTPLRIVGTLTDVTQWKFAEEKNRFHASLLNAVGQAVIATDINGVITYLNSAAESLYGWREDEAIGKNIIDVIVPQVSQAQAQDIMNHLSEGLVWSGEFLVGRRDGKHFLAEVHDSPIVDANGKLIGIIGVSTDISKRQADEAKLDRLIKLYSALNQCNQDILRCSSEDELFQRVCRDAVVLGGLRMAWVGLVDQESKMIKPVAWFGSGTEYLQGIEISAEANKPTGRGPIGIVVRENRPYWCQDYLNEPLLALWRERGVLSGWAASAALPLLRNDVVIGTLTLYAGEVNAFDEAERNLLVGMARDISYALTRFSLQAESVQLQTQLLQAQKMESVGHLTAGIAHDFNNILGAMMGYAELTQHKLTENQSNDVSRFQEEIIKSGTRAKELIKQLLTFSRLATDEHEEIAPVVALDSIVKEVVSMLRASIPSNINLGFSIEEANLKARIQPIQLHQILLNLIVNARDAIGEYGKIDIILSKQYYEKNNCSSCKKTYSGEYAKITVKDTGSGVPEGIINKIFDPFFSTKDVGKGSGMGLSVVHGLVHAQGGHINIESSAEFGTSINILLPRETSEANSSQQFVKSTQVVDISSARIMVVDDEHSLSTMLYEFLSAQAAHVIMFTDPKQALETFTRDPDSIDLVITDETMPGISGMLLAEKLLKVKPDLPIILCTGFSDHATPEAVENIGIAGFFYKPLKLNELLQRVQELLTTRVKRP